MKKRTLRFVAALVAAAIAVMGVVPVRSSAIVPLGLVQSALASYVTSAGYKLYNDQGTGQDILGSLGELYDDYVALNNKTISGSLATLAYLANSPLIYTDNSGQICINAVAANIMQDFADWMQSEYNVPVGSDTPTEVVQASGGSLSAVNDKYGTADSSNYFYYSFYSSPIPVTDGNFYVYYNGSMSYARLLKSGHAYSTVMIGSSYWRGPFFVSDAPFTCSNADGTSTFNSVSSVSKSGVPFYYYNAALGSSYNSSRDSFTVSSAVNDSLYSFNAVDLASDLFTFVYGGQVSSSGGLIGLGVTLAQAVTDVVGQAADDDAVVVGVGAGVGATAQDIAGLVADGVKAGTLEPSVSVVAESVIDTPVQPYPDIDGLGLPQLGAALTDRFPFCIPWDFVGALKLLNAEPIPPVFDVPLIPDSVKARWGVSGDTTLHVDLTTQEYAKLFLAIRWGTLIGFCIGLTLLTKRLIWTA